MKWEYCRIYSNSQKQADLDLVGMGNGGWELIAVIKDIDFSFILFFKKQTPNP